MADPDSSIRYVSGMYVMRRASYITGRVLDVGCGNKPYKRLFPECEWVGLDNRGVGDVEGDMHELPFEDESFDTVLVTDVLHLTPSPANVLGEAARVLKKGGNIVVVARCTTPQAEGVWYGMHPTALGSILVGLGLTGVDLVIDGAIISQEWADVKGFDKYNFVLPSEIGGWLDQMDKRYPAITGAVATKE